MGGGTMRMAVKAGIGIANASRKGMPLAPPAEQSVRTATRPVSAVVSSQSANPADVAPLHTAASLEMDDWKFADEGLVMDAGEPTPRLVFSGVPRNDATSELLDATDKEYLSSNSSDCGSSAGSQVSVLSPADKNLETKSCVSEATAAPSVVPSRAPGALSAEAQTAVASTASDSNLCTAVMKSPALKDFIQSKLNGMFNQAAVASIASDPNVRTAVMKSPGLKDFIQSKKKVAGFEAEESLNSEELSDLVFQKFGDQKPGFDFFGLLQNIRFTVVEVFSDMSNYLKKKFGFAGADETSSGDNGNTEGSFTDQTILGRIFAGLVVMVILVIFKRV